MKAPKLGVLAAAFAAIAAGCATVNYSSPGALEGISLKGVEGRQAVQQVVINTSGYYVLWTLPLASGDLRWNDGKQTINGGTTLFRDQVTAVGAAEDRRDAELRPGGRAYCRCRYVVRGLYRIPVDKLDLRVVADVHVGAACAARPGKVRRRTGK